MGRFKLIGRILRRPTRVAGCALICLLCTTPASAADEVPGVAANSAPAAPVPGWTLRLPKDEQVSYRGLARFDNAGGPGAQILYPAPGIAGLLVAIATHGAIVDAQKRAEKDRIQAAADSVLTPYRGVLDNYTHRDLMRMGLQKAGGTGEGRLVEFAAPRTDERIVESVPVFFMTADAKALVLDAAVVVYSPGGAQTPVYQNVIRVISEPQDSGDMAEFWNAKQGEQLREKSALLFARALEIVFKELQPAPAKEAAVHRTVRYMEGGNERMERGQVLGEQCDRVLIKNLRGWLMSVPARPVKATDVATASCSTVAGGAQVSR
jgi:hypothetical protein